MARLFEERRMRLRDHFAAANATYPPSVFDPISARLADHLGIDVALLGGSAANALLLGAPDFGIITISELAQLVLRINQAAEISLMVDADYGYGNALHAARTTAELEAAGASAVFFCEDTGRPVIGLGESEPRMVSCDEMTSKLSAAVAARTDPSMIIAGRTDAFMLDGDPDERLAEALRRAKAYASTGIDAIILLGVQRIEDLAAVHEATQLPILLGSAAAHLPVQAFRDNNVAIVMKHGHPPLRLSVRAIYEGLKRQMADESFDGAESEMASEELMDIATGLGGYLDRVRLLP